MCCFWLNLCLMLIFALYVYLLIESEESSTMSGPQQNNNRNLDSEELDLEVEMNSDDDDEDLFRRILAAAASRGISLDFLAPHLHHHGDDSDDDDDDVEYPFPSPPQSLEDVASFLKSEKCQKILVLAGAGMSVARYVKKKLLFLNSVAPITHCIYSLVCILFVLHV